MFPKLSQYVVPDDGKSWKKHAIDAPGDFVQQNIDSNITFLTIPFNFYLASKELCLEISRVAVRPSSLTNVF